MSNLSVSASPVFGGGVTEKLNDAVIPSLVIRAPIGEDEDKGLPSTLTSRFGQDTDFK